MRCRSTPQGIARSGYSEPRRQLAAKATLSPPIDTPRVEVVRPPCRRIDLRRAAAIASVDSSTRLAAGRLAAGRACAELVVSVSVVAG